MNFIDELKNKIKDSGKKIVLPEGEDERVIEAAKKASAEGIAKIIVISNSNNENENSNIEYINPSVSELTPLFIEELNFLYPRKISELKAPVWFPDCPWPVNTATVIKFN